MTVKTCVTCIYKSGSHCTKQWLDKPGERVNLVTGAVTRLEGSHFTCETQRRYTFNSCGRDGLWWSPIKPKVKKEKPSEPRKHSVLGRVVLRLLRVFA